LSSNIPTISKDIVLGKVPKIEDRKLVVVILTLSPTSTPKYLANQEPTITPFFEDRLSSDPLSYIVEE
jgi:hypothetical protein